MKTLTIALKDLIHSFKSPFSLIMMFGAPVLITGLLYFAFGGMSGSKDTFNLPVTKVVVANLDRPAAGASAGQMLLDFLREESLADVIQVSLSADEAAADRPWIARRQASLSSSRPTFPPPPLPQAILPA